MSEIDRSEVEAVMEKAIEVLKTGRRIVGINVMVVTDDGEVWGGGCVADCEASTQIDELLTVAHFDRILTALDEGGEPSDTMLRSLVTFMTKIRERLEAHKARLESPMIKGWS